MDAVTALSLASTLMQFVEYGSKLLSQAPQSYTSAYGTLSNTIDAEVLVVDLLSLNQTLKKQAPPKYTPRNNAQGADNAKALEALYERCMDVSQSLLAHLASLRPKPMTTVKKTSQHKAPPNKWRGLLGADALEAMDNQQQPGMMHFRTWDGFRRALRQASAKHEIEELEDAIWEIRRDLQFRILVSFRDALCHLASQRSQTPRELRKFTVRILDSFYKSEEDFISQIQLQSQRLLQLNESGGDDGDDMFGTSANDIVQSIGSFQALDKITLKKTQFMDKRLSHEIQCLIIDTCILNSLSFATMVDRRESVEKAHARTFDWIYKDAKISKVPWSNFVDWLRHGDGIYWINGKVGCGKSTLMRYLYENKTTQQQLKTWAGDHPCELYSFFFWNSGDEDQKSQLGLLRSLLFDILERHRSLMLHVMPAVWKTWSARARAAVEQKLPYDSSVLPPEPDALSVSELREVFQKVLELLSKSTKLCFFIDGLDEYGAEHMDIVQLMTQCAVIPNVKLCLSSRPWKVFQDSFDGLPTLRLQDLTHGDLCHYVRDSLYSQPPMEQLAPPEDEDVAHLIEEVVTKSAGVFLWVKLVVRSLVHELPNFDSMAELRSQICDLPGDLDSLFAHMLAVKDYQRASQILQIFQAARKRSAEKITLLQLSFADEANDFLAEEAPMEKITLDKKATRCQEMDSRLQGICAGLLESHDAKYSSMAPDGKVMFLHRTVSDWLAKPEVWEELVSQTAGAEFSPSLALLKSYILLVKGLDISPERPFDMRVISKAVQYAKDAEAELDSGFPPLFDQLDLAVAYQWRNGDCSAVYADDDMSDASSDTEEAPSEKSDGLAGSPSQLTTYLQSYRESMIEHQDGIFGTLNRGASRAKNDASMVGRTFAVNELAASYIAHREARFGGRTLEQPKELAPIRGRVATTYNHWTWGLEIPDVIPLHSATTFYDVARLMGMKHYVAAKDKKANVLDQDVGQHMLIRAVVPPSARPDAGIDPDEIERLLAGGADPNFSYQGPTPWQVALAGAGAQFAAVDGRSVDDLSPQFQNGCRNWIKAMRLFLQHDADPYAAGKVQNVQDRPAVSACTILESYAPAFLEEEALELMELLSKRRDAIDRKQSSRATKSRGLDIEGKTAAASVEWSMSWIPIRSIME